jgi:hypothetical protein
MKRALTSLMRRMGLSLLGLLALLGTAHAADISGAITANATWTAAQSPYVLHGDVILDNNATLVIQPGVQIRMAAGAGFTLKQGALQAVGTASNPIVITSDAASPQPGDWGQWRLASGTNSAQTMFNYVSLSYGSGLVIESCAPVLNNVSIQNHNGPAISIDLAASPTGRGLSASGNTVNAIAVPGGTVRGQVIWGLVGIPYLVQQGLVQVGQSPLSLDPAHLTLSPGVVAILRLSVNVPAPSGGLNVDLTSAVPSVASTVSSAAVAEGQTGADVQVQANAIGATTVTASHATLGSAQTIIDVVDLPTLEIAPGEPTIGVQRPYPMQLSLPQPAPAGGLAVTLSSSDPTVVNSPSSLLIPAGQQSLSFEVTGLTEGVSRLSAQAEGYATGLATVTVRAKALVLPAGIVVAPGAQVSAQLQLTEPAPAGGLTVNLSTASASTATVTGSVNVPENASQASFTVAGNALGTTTLTATASGYQSAQGAVRVDAISLDTDPGGNLTVNVDQAMTRRVLLSKAAPAGGITVQVAAADPSLASVSPAQVTVPEGQIYGMTPVTVKGLAVGQTTLEVSSPGLIGKSIPLSVQEKFALSLYQYNNQPKVTVGKALTTYSLELQVRRMVNGVVASGVDPVTVNLRCVDANICSVPATVTIPANNNTVNVQVTGINVGSTQIEATADGATAATPMPLEVIAPTIVFNSLDNTRTTASARDDFTLRLNVPGAYWSTNQAAAQAMTVNLSLPEQSPAGVVNGIYSAATGGTLLNQATINAGSNSTATMYVDQPAQAGTYRVGAEIPNVTSGLSDVQTVTAGNLSLSFYQYNNQPKVTVGKALATYSLELQVRRMVNGVLTSGVDPVIVSLRCVAETVCMVPATVTIPANNNTATVQVTGIDLGSTQIEASAVGFDPGTITVETVTPQLAFNSGPPASMTAGQQYTTLRASVQVPGAYWSTNQTAVLPFTLTLTSSVPSVATVSPSATWAVGSTVSGYATLSAVAPGVTRITASAPGFAPVTSGDITVNP